MNHRLPLTALVAGFLIITTQSLSPVAGARLTDADADVEFEYGLPRFSSVTDLAVSGDGRVYIAGTTTNSAFPATADAVDRTCNVDGRCGSVGDAFVMVLSAAGELLYATLLGGSQREEHTRLAVMPDGGIWLAGTTFSRDFTDRGHVAECDGGAIYIGLIRPGRAGIDDFRCLGGNAYEQTADLLFDGERSLWLVGWTGSYNFPTVDAWQPTLRGNTDVFLVRFAAGASEIAFATFLGGSGNDGAAAAALAPDGDLVVTGSTSSADFPLVRPVQTVLGHQEDTFLLRLDRSGTHLEYSTFLGGTGPIFGCCGGQDAGHDVAVDHDGNAYVIGWTNSADFPVTAGTVDPVCGSDGRCNSPLSDAFLASVGPHGELRFGTYLGGSRDDVGEAVATRADGSVLAVVNTQSPDFPSVNPWPTMWPPQPASGVPALAWVDNPASSYHRASLVPIATSRPFDVQAAAADERFLYLAVPVSAPTAGTVIRKLRLEAQRAPHEN
jgi:hypothetical protein